MENLSTVKNKILTLIAKQYPELITNPSFESKISYLLYSLGDEEQVTIQNVVEQEGRITFEYLLKNDEKYRISFYYSNPNEIKFIHDNGYDSSTERTIMEEKIIVMPGMGFEYHQNIVEMDAENCQQYTHNKNVESLRERYDKSGVMTKKKKTVFKPYLEKFAIDDINLTVGDHLFGARKYGNFDSGYNRNTDMHRLELSRTSHDVVKVTSEGINNRGEDVTYEGYQFLGDKNYVTLPTYPYFLSTAYEGLPGVGCIIDSKSDEEIKEELYSANLSTEQREFLFELAQRNERNKFSVNPTKTIKR